MTIDIKNFHGNKISYECFTFPGGEFQVKVPRLSVEGNLDVIIEANLTNASEIMKLLLLTDAVRREYNPRLLTLTLKYLPYARQDRVANDGESLSIKVFCDLINSQNYDRVYVYDCHSDVGLALLNRVRHVTQAMLFMESSVVKDSSKTVLVAPDAGARKKIMSCAKATSVVPVIFGDKVRDTITGNITGTVVNWPSNIEDIKNYRFIVVDDICDGGRTFVELGKKLREKLPEAEIDLYVTHGIFSHPTGVEVFKDVYNQVFCANLLREGYEHPLLKVKG